MTGRPVALNCRKPGRILCAMPFLGGVQSSSHPKSLSGFSAHWGISPDVKPLQAPLIDTLQPTFLLLTSVIYDLTWPGPWPGLPPTPSDLTRSPCVAPCYHIVFHLGALPAPSARPAPTDLSLNQPQHHPFWTSPPGHSHWTPIKYSSFFILFSSHLFF